MKSFLEWVGGEVFGWLSPKGILYPCGRFGHAALALKTPEIRMHIDEDAIKEIEDSNGEEDDSAREDAEADLSYELFRKGFLRVGSWGSDITFEGTPESIKSLYHRAKNIAEERGGKAVFEPMRA